MKSFIGASVAFFLLIFGIRIYTDNLNRCVDRMEACTENIIAAADRLDWQECNHALKELLENWNRAQKWFSVFIHHEEMEEINRQIYEIEMYIRYEKQAETAAKANVLKLLLKHIPENERFTAENLL